MSAYDDFERDFLNADTWAQRKDGLPLDLLDALSDAEKVKAGQILARLDDTNVKAGLDVARAQWESARTAVEETRAQLKQADLEFKRATELAKQNIASQSDLDRAGWVVVVV